MRRRSRGGKGGKGEQKFKVSDFEDLYFIKEKFWQIFKAPFPPQSLKTKQIKINE
jgi:hypothetical protein